MSEYAIGVVAHVDRTEMAHELAEKVHPKLVNVDNGELGCSGNHSHILSRLVGEPGWSVVLEDDAVPLNDFHDDLEAVLDIVSTELDPSIKIVGLYLGTGYPSNWQKRFAEAVSTDACFLVSPRLHHAVGYAVAPEIKKDLAGWMAKNRRGPGMAPDEGISVWAAAHRYKVAHTNPSLVDHQDTRTVIKARGQTFAPGRNRARKAHNTRQRLTWTDSVATLDRYGNQ